MKYKKPIILGILNVSPESNVKDSVAISKKAIIKRAKFLKKYGASYIDIGARSISAGQKKIDDKTELKRILPAIKILKERGYKVSVDTWSVDTAIKCLEHGADMINFTSSVYNAKLFQNLKKYKAWLIMTYMPYKNAYEMRSSKSKSFDFKKMMNYFKSKINLANKYDVKKIILDPNLGIFHSDIDKYQKISQQMYIINNLHKLKSLKYRIMVYTPRKNNVMSIIILSSFILQNNPNFIRTHDPDIIHKLLSLKNG